MSTAQCVLAPEDMLLVMELAGWTYIPESDHDYAHAFPNDNHTTYAWSKHGALANKPEADNIRECFRGFIAKQEGKQ